MIDPSSGMKPGIRYVVESLERTRHFPGFFLDGKYYLGPELMTAIGWLEGTRFFYDELDIYGDPIFPESLAGTIENLTLTLADGARLQLNEIEFHSKEASLADESSLSAAIAPQKSFNALNDKLVVITGASSGIGRAAAHAFAIEGARLVLAARDYKALSDVVGECVERGASAMAVPTDVTNSDQMRALAKKAASYGDGRIDIWINNAGVGAVGSFEETPLEAHEQVLQTDLLGYLRGAYVAWPYFKSQKSGILINTLSLGSWVAQPYAAAYSASKYGLRGLSEALRGELHRSPDIHVCDIYPAVMDTPGFRDGGNFTGHTLKPPPPVYDPRLVAAAMVRCALRPKQSVTVGRAATLARIAHFLIPGFPQISGWLTRLALRHRPQAHSSAGNLYSPTNEQRRIEGGWRAPTNHSPIVIAIGALVLGGVLLALKRRNNSLGKKRL